MNPQELIDAVKLTGEGRGRLSFGESENQYLFGVESVLNDHSDWMIAVSVPFKGEEVLIFPDLKQKNIENDQIDSFGARIQSEFRKLNWTTLFSGKEFLKELRFLIRFQLAASLGLARNCRVQQGEGECILDGETFHLQIREKELKIKKVSSRGSLIILSAQNLTHSFFSKTQISLYVGTQREQHKRPNFSLELFW